VYSIAEDEDVGEQGGDDIPTRGNVVVNIPKAVPLVLSTICHFLVTQCILHMC